MNYRENGIKALSLVLNSEKNCKTFEDLIFQKTENDIDIYNWCLYQVIGMLLKDKNEMKEIAKNIKKGKIGWDNIIYNDIKLKIEEYDDYLLKPFDVVEGVVQCGKCHSKKTWSVQKQTRGGDEPMTTFSKCVECSYQWSYSG